MTREWVETVATFEARQLLVNRLADVNERGYWRLIGALAYLFRSEAKS